MAFGAMPFLIKGEKVKMRIKKQQSGRKITKWRVRNFFLRFTLLVTFRHTIQYY